MILNEDTIIIKGFLSQTYEGDSHGEIRISGEILAEKLSKLDLAGKFIFVRYFVSDKETTIAELDFRQACVALGDPTIEFGYNWGTEWTGVYGVTQDFIIGDHDLMAELGDKEGKFLILEISTVTGKTFERSF